MVTSTISRKKVLAAKEKLSLQIVGETVEGVENISSKHRHHILY